MSHLFTAWVEHHEERPGWLEGATHEDAAAVYVDKVLSGSEDLATPPLVQHEDGVCMEVFVSYRGEDAKRVLVPLKRRT